MEEIVNEIVERLKRDILSNKSFVKSLMKDIKLSKENIDPQLIIEIMSQLGKYDSPPVPKTNRTMEVAEEKKRQCNKPITVGEGDVSKIIADILAGNNVYLHGLAGTGKTYMAKAIAECVMQQPVYTINCSQWTSPINILGGQTITGYKEGALIEAWQFGGILILDELPKLDPNTAGLLNEALAETAAMPKYDKDGKVVEATIPYITNGMGKKIYRGEKATGEVHRFRFGVIATGNTDMKSVDVAYSGNQRQDYSLVDRFSGSYYTVSHNTMLEIQLTYSFVYSVSSAIRTFLTSQSAIESISLRTMLNFNRTYENFMLYRLESIYADKIYDNAGNEVAPKSFDDALASFIDNTSVGAALKNYDGYIQAVRKPLSEAAFEYEFALKYRKGIKGQELSARDIEALKQKAGIKDKN